MGLRLFNTLSNEVEPFEPLKPGEATFYSCGPTVYDFAHIGNFRSFLAADVLRRWLESPLGPGLKVRQVMNITDVGHMVDDSAADGGGEDKMEEARRRLAQDKKSGTLPPEVAATIDSSSPTAIADYYAGRFLQDARSLGMRVVADADDAVKRAGDEKARDKVMPRPTRMIPEMLAMIVELLRRGHAYQQGGVVYFDTQTFPDYGQLSGNTLDRIRSGAGGRVNAAAQAAKKHPADFMLWKGDRTHLMRWDPLKVLAGRDRDDAERFGLIEGYPGWHIECSAMARALLGEQIDLHSGGEDNIFPHHECEIAQSRCAGGTPGNEPPRFARHWFHPRFLQVEGAKMSKSKGNFFTLRDLVSKGFSPAAIRLELIKTHYRSNANFTEQGLKDAERMAARWREFVARGDANPSADAVAPEEARRGFADAMNDDLNTAGALGAVNAWIGRTPQPTRTDAALMREIDNVLGVLALETPAAAGKADDPEAATIEDLVRRRTEARAAKNWPESDRIRDELARLNVVVTDTPQGPKWSRKAGF
ncbi:MAG: cysteine--tRNA ligase [Planctomycetes bacterium]|nr:cysteine--tRNA ligase [Planctomycetota bacterium]